MEMLPALPWTGWMVKVKISLIGVAGILVVLAAIVMLVSCGQEPEVRRAGPSAAKDTAPGGEAFRSNCAACHGAGGEGQPDWNVRKADGLLPAPPLNGDGHTWHHGDGTLYRIVSQGGGIYESPDLPNYKSGMPGFGGVLSHAEIIAVINYIKSLWGDKVAAGLGLPIRESQAVVSETDPFPGPPR